MTIAEYKKQLGKGLFLEDLNILVDYNSKFEELRQKFENCEITENINFDYKCIKIKTRLFALDIIFTLYFNFVHNKLTSINLADENIDGTVMENFEYVQNILLSKLGKPNKGTIKINSIKKYKWSINKISIIHELFDGLFGLSQTLTIVIN